MTRIRWTYRLGRDTSRYFRFAFGGENTDGYLRLQNDEASHRE